MIYDTKQGPLNLNKTWFVSLGGSASRLAGHTWGGFPLWACLWTVPMLQACRHGLTCEGRPCLLQCLRLCDFNVFYWVQAPASPVFILSCLHLYIVLLTLFSCVCFQASFILAYANCDWVVAFWTPFGPAVAFLPLAPGTSSKRTQINENCLCYLSDHYMPLGCEYWAVITKYQVVSRLSRD